MGNCVCSPMAASGDPFIPPVTASKSSKKQQLEKVAPEQKQGVFQALSGAGGAFPLSGRFSPVIGNRAPAQQAWKGKNGVCNKSSARSTFGEFHFFHLGLPTVNPERIFGRTES